MIGLSFSPKKPQVRLKNPSLPSLLNWVRIHNLRFGHATVDLALHRHPRDVGLNIERKVRRRPDRRDGIGVAASWHAGCSASCGPSVFVVCWAHATKPGEPHFQLARFESFGES